MSAETLRRAAALMRERAEAATWAAFDMGVSGWHKERWGGPSEDEWPAGEYVCWGEGHVIARCATREDMRYIAGMHPAVALAVADWLEAEADWVEAMEQRGATADNVSATAVARAYLGESP